MITISTPPTHIIIIGDPANLVGQFDNIISDHIKRLSLHQKMFFSFFFIIALFQGAQGQEVEFHEIEIGD